MPIVRNSRLSEYGYYGVGGTADVIYAPATLAELAQNVREVRRRGQVLMLLGGGTNSLIMDEHFPGAVILFRDLNWLETKGHIITAGAGVENTRLAEEALTHGLAGAAWMNRLPGQLGGTVRMNARCYGGEISQVVTRVWAVTADGQEKEYSGSGLFRGYKDTVFMTNGDLIGQVEVSLEPGDAAQIKSLMQHCEHDRKSKGQFDHPSCGCVFKNDYNIGISSGILLDAAGVKGMRVGGAVVSSHHANFVYNQGASSRDILELTLMMRDRVYDAFGVWLEYEMEVLGIVPQDLSMRIKDRKPNTPNVAALAPLKEKMRR